jgi:glyoxylase-like metal-dependent hydrolase (beta-lactamase superfamily II)
VTPIPFDHNFQAPYGERIQVSPLIARVLAPNPGPFTFRGTGVYIIGTNNVAVIDPGPDIPVHVETLKDALRDKHVSHILLTHTHNDHSPAAGPLKAWTGAKTYAYGPHPRQEEHGVKVEEGGDTAFEPDVVVGDGEVLTGDGFTIECVFTPGHTSNHMCYALREEQALFTGDHVMGWSTSVVAPPDGDMTAYRASLAKLLARDDRVLWPTHGGPIRDPKPFLQAYLAHRAEREAQIITCLRDGITTIPEIVARLYVDVDKRLYPAAGLSVLAHLIELVQQNRATADPAPLSSATYRLAR